MRARPAPESARHRVIHICRLGRVDHRGGAKVRPSRLWGDLPHLYFRNGPGSPTISARGCARPAACRTSRWSATPKRGRVPARAGEFQRQGRRDRLLLRRPPCVSDRLPAARDRRLVDCWGGNVIVDDKSLLNASDRSRRSTSRAAARSDARIFGNDDQNPMPTR